MQSNIPRNKQFKNKQKKHASTLKKMSETGISMLKEFEGLSLKPYRDSERNWTNGYGNTLNVDPHRTISRRQAEADLRQHLADFENTVNNAVLVEINQNQFDALVSFVYNVGISNFRNSTLLKKLNAGDYFGAQSQFKRWNKITKNGKKIALKGLSNRRASEARLFALTFEPKPIAQSRTMHTAAVTVASGVGTVVSTAPEVIKENLSLVTAFSDWRMIFGVTVIICGIAAAVLKLQDRKGG